MAVGVAGSLALSLQGHAGHVLARSIPAYITF